MESDKVKAKIPRLLRKRPPSAVVQIREDQEREEQERIRNRLISIVGLFLIVALLFWFLLNYQGISDWHRLDANLTVFVAVTVNIVLLTTVFYLILRNLFKLVYERKKAVGGVGLKTKLIIAFVALSLPSTAFHLMASGFMAFLFDSWSKGEHRQALDSSRVVVEALDARQAELMRRSAEDLLAYLPRQADRYARADWLSGYTPGYAGGVFVYRGTQLIQHWVSSPEMMALWQPPPPGYLPAKSETSWFEHAQGQPVRRLVVPIPNGANLTLELLQSTPPQIAQALDVLARKQESAQFLGRDLLLLVLTILIVMTLFIIFAATWMAFYLARGFVTPVEILAEATQRVSQGELGYQVAGHRLGPLEGDFRELVTSFNMMSRQLKEQRQQLVRSAEDLRRSGHQLEERNRLVELLLENIDAGIAAVNPQGQITAMNRAALRLLQPRVEPWHERHYRAVLPKETVEVVEDMQAVVGKGTPAHPPTQLYTLTVKGRPVHVEASALALQNQQGQSEGLVLMLKDVTALQRTQRALAWREVARRVAHEIKNPLTPIQLSAQRIRRKYLGHLDGEGGVLDSCTQTIIDEVASLKKMVNEFSQFAKLPESKPVPDDLNEVIREVARFYEHGLPEPIRLQLELDALVPRFPLDREQLKRVFTNLIDNAAASIKGQGTIGIHSAYQSGSGQVLVEVADTGSGVPEHIRTRLFEPYTSTKVGGTGLGLAIVNQIVSDHNGDIRYAENKPHGSVFSMEFHLR